MRVPAILLAAALAASSAEGASPDEYLDTTFGEQGIVTLPGQKTARVALQLADGSLIVVTEAPDTYETTSLMKLDRAGSVDRSFGEQGRVRVDPASDFTSLHHVFEDAGGRIVVSGWLYPPTRPYLKRFNADGTPDQGFGRAGVVDLDRTVLPPGNCVQDIVLGYHPVAGGGAIVVLNRGHSDCTGYLRDSSTYLMRITASGALDVSSAKSLGAHRSVFGSRLLADGTLELSSSDGIERWTVDGQNLSIASLVQTVPQFLPQSYFRQADGSWIVQADYAAPFEVRLTDGTPDASFGTAGRPTEFELFGASLSMAVRLPDGVVGAASVSEGQAMILCVWRASGRIEKCGRFLDWREFERGTPFLAADAALYLGRSAGIRSGASLVRLNLASVGFFSPLRRKDRGVPLLQRRGFIGP